MKAGIFFTGTGPILILTSYKSLDDPNLAEKLKLKGIKKYIAYEVPEDQVKHQYGQHFNVILGDLTGQNLPSCRWFQSRVAADGQSRPEA